MFWGDTVDNVPNDRPKNALASWSQMKVESNTGEETFFNYQQQWFVDEREYDATLTQDGNSLSIIDRSGQGQNVVLYKKT